MTPHTRADLTSIPPQIIDKKALSLKKLAADGKDTPGGRMAHSLRSLGSAALNFAHVATGQLDMYQEIGCWSWDVCAGIVIAREAGGKVCDWMKTRPNAGCLRYSLQIYGRKGAAWTHDALLGHHFFIIRGIADNKSTGETGEDVQNRLAKDYFATVEDWDV